MMKTLILSVLCLSFVQVAVAQDAQVIAKRNAIEKELESIAIIDRK